MSPTFFIHAINQLIDANFLLKKGMAKPRYLLVLWISKAEDNKIYDDHGRAVVNFHCSINLYILLSLLLFFALPGYNYYFTAGIFIYGITASIVSLMSALSAQNYYYYLSIPFLRPRTS